MRWTKLLAFIGVVAGASFAVNDEAQNLLAQCITNSKDWYARLVILTIMFVLHSLVLSAGAFAVLKFRWASKGVLKRICEFAVLIVVAYAVGFCMLIIDPVLSYLVSVTCSALQACDQSSFGESLLIGAYQAAEWPNTPVATFMITLFIIVAVLVREVANSEDKASEQHSVA